MMNPYTGEVSVNINNLKGTLCYDWKALSAIKAELDVGLIQSANDLDIDQLSVVMEIGFRKKSPEITRKTIIDCSPPVLTMMQLVGQALAFAYLGPEDRDEKKEEEGKEINPDEQKKSLSI